MAVSVGIPRALMYHYYQAMWEAFFNELGIEIKLSPLSNKKIIDQGVKVAVDDICLPFKVYYGHVLELKDEVDYLFVPRFVSLGKYNYVCPKFMGLPDMLRAGIDYLPPLIEPVVDMRKGMMPLRRIAYRIGRKLKKSFWEIEKGYRAALNEHEKFENNNLIDSCKINNYQDISEGEETGGKSSKMMNIAVLGHAYIIYDQFISMNIIQHLENMGVNVYTVEMFEPDLLESAASLQSKRVFWYFNRKVMGTAYHLLDGRDNIDGIVQVTAFGCGPDSLVKELIDIKGKRRGFSILNISLDEHSGEAGLITRLEAFVDLLERRRMA